MAEQRNPYLKPDLSSDLGFGSVVASQPGLRLLNRDGSFNVTKPQLRWVQSVASYHRLLTMSWPKFLLIVLAAYSGINLLFAFGYLLLGPRALQGDIHTSTFLRDFFFSIHSFATIGYGNIVPEGTMANLLVALEALVGLLGFALVAGIAFARFSRPVADILYSKTAVIAPYQGLTSFEFRIVNARESQLIELHAKVTFSRFEDRDGGPRQRVFTPLFLERESVSFFPLSWTVVHPIDENSPLFRWTKEKLLEAQAEFLILLTGIDETFAQTVHSRSSYSAAEIIWQAKFAPMFRDVEGAMELDISKLGEITQTGSQSAAD